MKLRKMGFSFLLASLLLDVGSMANAQASIVTDKGVTFGPLWNLTTDGNSMQRVPLIFGTNGDVGLSGASPYSIKFRAWDGKGVDNLLVSVPISSNWKFSKSTTRNVTSSRCGSSIFGFSCADAATDGVLSSADSGRSVRDQTTTISALPFSSSAVGARVGAGHAVGNHVGAGFGTGSITQIPEPKLYAMMLAGLGLMGFVAQRRQQNATV